MNICVWSNISTGPVSWCFRDQSDLMISTVKCSAAYIWCNMPVELCLYNAGPCSSPLGNPPHSSQFYGLLQHIWTNLSKSCITLMPKIKSSTEKKHFNWVGVSIGLTDTRIISEPLYFFSYYKVVLLKVQSASSHVKHVSILSKPMLLYNLQHIYDQNNKSEVERYLEEQW